MNVKMTVLNYNGEALLPRCLPIIIEAKKVSKYSARATVIDNESSENRLGVLENHTTDI